MAIPQNTPFQGPQTSMFDVVTQVMGFAASWTPAAGGDAKTGTVLFNNPTVALERYGYEWSPDYWRMEYRHGIFDGLYDLVKNGAIDEVVVIDNISYSVRTVEKLYDGKTYVAELKPV